MYKFTLVPQSTLGATHSERFGHWAPLRDNKLHRLRLNSNYICASNERRGNCLVTFWVSPNQCYKPAKPCQSVRISLEFSSSSNPNPNPPKPEAQDMEHPKKLHQSSVCVGSWDEQVVHRLLPQTTLEPHIELFLCQFHHAEAEEERLKCFQTGPVWVSILAWWE